MRQPKLYTIAPHGERDRTAGPWRVSINGNRYATVIMTDGTRYFVGVEKTKRVRIPYKPRGQNIGWQYAGFVNDHHGRAIVACKVEGTIGVRGLLKLAGLVPPSERERERAERHAENVARVSAGIMGIFRGER